MSTVPSNLVESAAPRRTLRAQCGALARDIKISHSLFAMPFALLSTFLAAKMRLGSWPHIGQIGLIVLCMVTARTVAMSVNRLIDAEMDARNPRTARRAIPSGKMSRGFVWAVVALCAATFIASTALFWITYQNRWPLILSIPVLAFISAYPLLKRFTRLCHYYLGASLALAPICAWIAIAGGINWPPVVMAAAVMLWTAGFDIIYACQDYQSDLETGTFSVPAKMGIANALWVARFTHVACVIMLIGIGVLAYPIMGTLYFIGVTIAALLLVIEHSIVKPTDLSKVGLAFFTLNGIISLSLGTLGIIDILTAK